MTTQQKRLRWTPEELADAADCAARMTRAEERLVSAEDVLRLAARAGLRAIQVCVTCKVAAHCNVHGPAPATKTSKSDPAHVRYARAYADGQIEATGESFALPTDSGSRMALVKMATTYGFVIEHGNKAAIHGGELLVWFRGTSAAFRRATADAAVFGYSPRRCLAWLDAGRPTTGAQRGRSTRQEAPASNGQKGEVL